MKGNTILGIVAAVILTGTGLFALDYTNYNKRYQKAYSACMEKFGGPGKRTLKEYEENARFLEALGYQKGLETRQLAVEVSKNRIQNYLNRSIRIRIYEDRVLKETREIPLSRLEEIGKN